MIRQEDVTIIIPHLGGSSEAEFALDQCWQSLEETAPGIKKVLVLNGAKGERCTNPKHLFNADIVTTFQGQCKAVNMAIASTDTPWVFITNDDMVYPPGWFDKLSGYEKFNCVSAKLVEPRNGAPTFIVNFCGGAGGDFDRSKFYQFVEDNKDTESRVITGFNFPVLIRRHVWETVRGYDINYDPWGSNGDSDLEYKIMLSGIQPVQAQDLFVYHFSQTSGTFEPRNNDAWKKNWEYFKDKWGFYRTDDGIWEANFKIPIEGRLFCPTWENKYL